MSDWVFTIHEPGRSPRQVPIQQDLGLGRAEDCECTLRDQAASSWHAIVKDIEGRLALLDLGSTNRTRVRGGPVLGRGDYVFLKPGLELLIGRTVLLVEPSAPVPEGTLRIDSASSPQGWDESGVTNLPPTAVRSSWTGRPPSSSPTGAPPERRSSEPERPRGGDSLRADAVHAESVRSDAPASSWRIERRRIVLGRPDPRPVPVDRGSQRRDDDVPPPDVTS